MEAKRFKRQVPFQSFFGNGFRKRNNQNVKDMDVKELLYIYGETSQRRFMNWSKMFGYLRETELFFQLKRNMTRQADTFEMIFRSPT